MTLCMHAHIRLSLAGKRAAPQWHCISCGLRFSPVETTHEEAAEKELERLREIARKAGREV